MGFVVMTSGIRSFVLEFPVHRDFLGSVKFLYTENFRL